MFQVDDSNPFPAENIRKQIVLDVNVFEEDQRVCPQIM